MQEEPSLVAKIKNAIKNRPQLHAPSCMNAIKNRPRLHLLSIYRFKGNLLIPLKPIISLSFKSEI